MEIKCFPSSTIAAAVSSQLDSMPKIYIVYPRVKLGVRREELGVNRNEKILATFYFDL